MTIYLSDGSTLTCSTIELWNGYFVADGYREVHTYDVDRIEEGDNNNE